MTHKHLSVFSLGLYGFDIYALRIGNVMEPHEYAELFPHYFKHPEVRCRNSFCYIDARDLEQIVDLCLEKDGLGFQVFNAGNDHNGAIIPSKELAERIFSWCANYPRIRGTRSIVFQSKNP